MIPEIHISFFEPETLGLALRASGFRRDRIPSDRGFDEIIKFKVLKNLKLRRLNVLTDLISATPLAAAADRKVHLRDHPVGWAA